MSRRPRHLHLLNDVLATFVVAAVAAMLLTTKPRPTPPTTTTNPTAHPTY